MLFTTGIPSAESEYKYKKTRENLALVRDADAIIEKEWVSSDCSSEWFYYLECYHGCDNGECKDEESPPEQESKGQ